MTESPDTKANAEDTPTQGPEPIRILLRGPMRRDGPRLPRPKDVIDTIDGWIRILDAIGTHALREDPEVYPGIGGVEWWVTHIEYNHLTRVELTPFPVGTNGGGCTAAIRQTDGSRPATDGRPIAYADMLPTLRRALRRNRRAARERMGYTFEEAVAATRAVCAARATPGRTVPIDDGTGTPTTAVTASRGDGDDADVIDIDVLHRDSPQNGWQGVHCHGTPAEDGAMTPAAWADLAEAALRVRAGRDPETGLPLPPEAGSLTGRSAIRRALTAEMARNRQTFTMTLHGTGDGDAAADGLTSIEVYFRGHGPDGPDWRIGASKHYGGPRAAMRRAWARLTGADDGGDDAPPSVAYRDIPKALRATIEPVRPAAARNGEGRTGRIAATGTRTSTAEGPKNGPEDEPTERRSAKQITDDGDRDPRRWTVDWRHAGGTRRESVDSAGLEKTLAGALRACQPLAGGCATLGDGAGRPILHVWVDEDGALRAGGAFERSIGSGITGTVDGLAGVMAEFCTADGEPTTR